MNPFRSFRNLSKFEWALWGGSVIILTVSFLCGQEFQPLTLAASLIGVTSLIFVSKGDVLGQALIVAFSLLYAVISWRFRYYGEMITYLGMTAPMAVLSIVSWVRHPYKEHEVRVAALTRRKLLIVLLLTAAVTMAFYVILKRFHTANLVVSTVSVATSFVAASLTFCRSSWYALAYAANDAVLVVLWLSATIQNAAYLPMTVCFVLFFANDLYGYVSWRRMQKRQNG